MKLKITHGVAAWRDKRCRCDVCRLASAAEARRCQLDREARLKADPTVAKHGSASTYRNWGCRCQPCTEAQSAEWHRYMSTPSTPRRGRG